ncbi:MAG: hypothetical protein U0172_05770 [Nitrospiraceae bacterium]
MPSAQSHDQVLAPLAELMLAVAGESVTMVKKSAPERAMKMKRSEEWDVYLEFLKLLFNMADRISVLHIPLVDQPEFMNALEDRVTGKMKTLLGQALTANADPMELTLTVGNAVAQSRQLYERYRFMATEESSQKSEMLTQFGQRVAQVMGDPKNGQLSSAAVLCAGAVLPAMQALFTGASPAAQTASTDNGATAAAEGRPRAGASGTEIKLVSVMASIAGEEVETRWGLHPRFRRDLTSQEAQELTKLMNRLTKIVGERYASVAFSEQWASWHTAGHA